MMITDWQVLGPRLLVHPIDRNSGASIERPESADEEGGGMGLAQGQECEIVLIGGLDAAKHARLGVFGDGIKERFHPGQRVYIARYKGCAVEIDGEELVVVDVETDVLLINKGVGA